ncbi:MAG: hypothetical protein SXQ77_09400 [Halobacteria archaeon]|nr:hypothetical protein [Halobacteria archaeon]
MRNRFNRLRRTEVLLSVSVGTALSLATCYHLYTEGLRLTGAGALGVAALYVWIFAGMTTWYSSVVYVTYTKKLITPVLLTALLLAQTVRTIERPTPHDPFIVFVLWFVPSGVFLAVGKIEKLLRERARNRWTNVQ